MLSRCEGDEEDLFVDEDSQIIMPKLLSTEPNPISAMSTMVPQGPVKAKSEDSSSSTPLKKKKRTLRPEKKGGKKILKLPEPVK